MVKYDNKTQKAKQKDFKQHTKVYQRFETRSKRLLQDYMPFETIITGSRLTEYLMDDCPW